MFSPSCCDAATTKYKNFYILNTEIPKVISGSKTVNTGTSGIDHWGILANADVNHLLGVSDASVYNTTVIFANGDYDANAADITTYYDSGTWYAKFNQATRGNIRVNYIVMYTPA